MDSDDVPSSSHVTITILPAILSLVHIPRSRLPELTRPILKQLFQPQAPFLNLTCNAMELSIFADEDMISEFEPIAMQDRQRQRAREKHRAVSKAHRRRVTSNDMDNDFQPVEVSFEKWKVLQIDSHEDSSLSNSGSRVRELSAPLAAAGISILYQSSYMSDFIFVKAFRLLEVLQLLDAAGFSLYSDQPEITAALSATSSFNHQISPQEMSMSLSTSMSKSVSLNSPGPGTMSPSSGAVLSRTRSPSLASMTALSLAMSRAGTTPASPTSPSLTSPFSHLPQTPTTATSTSGATRQSKKSLSPTAAPVTLLAPDLACVGLTETDADVWLSKIVKLVGFPELIPIPASSGQSGMTKDSLTRGVGAGSLYASRGPRVRGPSPAPAFAPGRRSPEFTSEAEEHGTTHNQIETSHVAVKQEARHSRSHFLPRADSLSSHASRSPYASSESEEDLSAPYEDDYHSCPSPYTRTAATPSLVSLNSVSSARSLPELEVPPQRLSHRSTPPGMLSRNNFARSSDRETPPSRQDRVPFFSFTRTSEGSSLTTSLRALAALFAPHERHMLICRDALLDTADTLNLEGPDDWDNDFGSCENEGGNKGLANELFEFVDRDEGECEGDDLLGSGTMKCLQIDLQKFGLDKHGLVNRFSRVLEENGINHMYSSTFKTANLLVQKSYAIRAQSLLRSC